MNPQNIQRERKKAKLTQADLARILGVKQATVSKYESGEIVPSVEQLERMAEAFGISFATLVSNETEIIPGRLKVIEVDDPDSGSIAYQLEATDEEALSYGLQIFENAGINSDFQAQQRLFNAFSKLNPAGQAIAVDRIEELCEIAKYRK